MTTLFVKLPGAVFPDYYSVNGIAYKKMSWDADDLNLKYVDETWWDGRISQIGCQHTWDVSYCVTIRPCHKMYQGFSMLKIKNEYPKLLHFQCFYCPIKNHFILKKKLFMALAKKS